MQGEADAVRQDFPVPQLLVETGEAAVVRVLPVVLFQIIYFPVEDEAGVGDAVGHAAHGGSHIEFVCQQMSRFQQHVGHSATGIRHYGGKPTGAPVGQFHIGSG